MAAVRILMHRRSVSETQLLHPERHHPLAKQGVVAHTLSSCHRHKDYHRRSNDVSRVEAAHLAAVINATARVIELLANGAPPSWKPGGRS